MKILIFSLLVIVAYASVSAAFGQSCRPAELGYFVRDAKGKHVSQEKLRAITIQMPKPALEPGRVALAADGTLVGYSSKPTKKKLAALQQSEAGECRLKVGEMTLRHGGMTMRLIFNLDINRAAYYIDSLRFQNGSFELDKKGLSESGSDKIISAKVWKKVGDKP